MKVAAVSVALIMALGGSAAQAESVIRAEEWTSYVESFVADEGRVVDTGNNNISHSEGQGYGLILSVLADDRPTFERIWSFTSTELLVRDDGLAAWRWDPASSPHITDTNNATDGDMLIAYGLALAGEAWDAPDYTAQARQIVQTIGQKLLVQADGMPAILPGADGFAEPANGDGPILNPSYWVFETLPVFAELDPSVDWNSVGETGLELVRKARISRVSVPPDWLVLDDEGQIQPAADFPAEFGYNGISIPLYMMRAGSNMALLDAFREHADAEGLYKVDAVTGQNGEPIREPGYRLISAAMTCIAEGTKVPDELTTMAATSYYASTLQLLTLDYLRRSRPECLGGASP